MYLRIGRRNFYVTKSPSQRYHFITELSIVTIYMLISKAIDKQIPAPGIEQFYEKDEVIEHSYYQWVSLQF